jgi:L-malate glycosyltransferase
MLGIGFLVSLLFGVCGVIAFLKKFFKISHFDFNMNQNNISSPHRMLIVCMSEGRGGKEAYSVDQYQSLFDNGVFVTFLTAKNARITEDMKERKLSFYTCSQFRISFGKRKFQPTIKKAIHDICKKEKVTIVHCHERRVTCSAKKVAKKLSIKVVYTRHVPDELSTYYLNNMDGVIGVNPNIVRYLKKERKKIKNKSLPVVYIPPFFNEKRLLNFKSTRTRIDFFYQEFGIVLKNVPLLCKIANLYSEGSGKNHPLLFKAVAKLIYERKFPVQLALAGEGRNKKKYEKMVRDFEIQKYVHFLGYTKKLPELLYHSDIKILASKKEAFGIVLLEAAIIKKPIIVATGTGAADIFIIHNETGLLFENNNVDSLVKNIELLLNNPELGRRLGENAYTLSMDNFCSESNCRKLIKFYWMVS